jgi:predicted RecA/RadA family phage recombinase
MMKRIMAVLAVAAGCLMLGVGLVMCFVPNPAQAAYTEEPYTAGLTAGDWFARSTDPGTTLRIIESSLTHPSHSDGFVDKGDPVLVGDEGIAGVALESATAATDYVNIGTRGIINLSLTNASAMAIGDEVFINTTTAALTDASAGSIKFGHVLTAIAGTGSAVVRAVIITPVMTVSSFTSVAASGDLYVGDDGFIGDDLDIGGLVTVDETLTASTSLAAADIYAGDDLVVEDDATIDGDLATTTIAVGGGTVFSGVWVSSGTLVDGATSCNVTLGTTPVIASDYIVFSLVPDTIGEDYAGHGDAYMDLEGGTAAEVKITSATYIDLAAYVWIYRK